MEDFQVIRKGDEITLSFKIFVERTRADFSLIGPKMSFYRMAMGQGLMDTLKEFLAHDERYLPEGAASDKENITLAIATKDAAPAQKSATVETTAPSKEQFINKAYAAALESNDPLKLFEFANTYPDSPKAPMARKFAERLLSDKEYEKLGDAADLKTLSDFLAKYPSTRYAPQINMRIMELKKEEAARQSEIEKRRAQAEAEKIRKQEEEQARKAQAAEEKRQQELARKERDAFNRAKGNIDALKAYLADYPEGAYAAEASAAMARMQKEAEEEAKATGGKQKLTARFAARAPLIDGDGSDPAWSSAPPVSVDLEPQTKRAVKTTVEVRALQTADRIFFRLRWRDNDGDTQYRPWLWDSGKAKYAQSEKMDDAAAVAVYASKDPDDSCMLYGQPQKTDIWLWRANWSEISGKASDQLIVSSRDRLPKSNPYLSRDGKGQLWVQNLTDRGKQAWSYDIPLPGSNPPPLTPSYRADTPSGSAADVDARGKYKDGYWTVEFARELDTGNDDDVAIPKTGKVLVSFATYEKADRNDHSSGPLVILETLGR